MSIRVVIADDQPLIRSGLRALLETEPTIDVVGEATDGLAAVELARSTQPDVALMDIRMPGIDGIEATRRIRAEHAGVAVVVLTTFDIDEYVFDAVRAGASGFLLKDGSADDLVHAIQVAARGEALVAPRMLRRLLDEFSAQVTATPDMIRAVGALTNREREVLALVAQGMTNREIAERLVVGEATVKTHIGSLLAKLACRDRTQLVIVAYEAGLTRNRH